MTTGAGLILVVEDDRDIRETLQEALEDEGYTVVGTFDGLDALEHLRAAAELPKLILLDLMMPRMNGMQFREEMRKVLAWAGIPVLVISADAEAQTKAETLQVAGCLQKPIKLRTLYETVASLIRDEE